MSARESNAFSTLRLRLTLDHTSRHRLDMALLAVGQLERALTRSGLRNLDAMKRTRRWSEVCGLPTGLSPSGEIVDPRARRLRNAALQSLRREFHLTEYDFVAQVLKLRRESRWLCDHVPSSSSMVHATQVYEAFAAHLFRGAGRPRVPQPGSNCSLLGYVRDAGRSEATHEEVAIALAKGNKVPQARNAKWSGLFLSGSMADDDIVVHLHPSRTRSRHLAMPARTQIGGRSARDAWYLNDPDLWHQVKIVRRSVRSHDDYEAHLVCTRPPYRDPARYAEVPDAVVGVDVGVSSLAAVGICPNGTVADALLVRPTVEELERRCKMAQKQRRTHRALDRSRRATNPDAYAPDRHGRPGRGSRILGTRLSHSKSYRRRRLSLRDDRRREREARAIVINRTATLVIQRCGKSIITEDVNVGSWKRTWGRSIDFFAPGEFSRALEREACLAGGSLTKVPCRLGLTQTCHCGAVKKKPLSQRWHRCEVCGAGYATPPIDRDLHSAYLAAFVTIPSEKIDVTLNTDRAFAAWSGAEASLVAVSGDPLQGETSPSRSRVASSWSRHKASDRAGRATASDVNPNGLGRAGDSFTGDVGVGKAHTARLRNEASISQIGGQGAPHTPNRWIAPAGDVVSLR